MFIPPVEFRDLENQCQGALKLFTLLRHFMLGFPFNLTSFLHIKPFSDPLCPVGAGMVPLEETFPMRMEMFKYKGDHSEQLPIDLHQPFPLRGQVDPKHAWKKLLAYMESFAFAKFSTSFIQVFPLVCHPSVVDSPFSGTASTLNTDCSYPTG